MGTRARHRSDERAAEPDHVQKVVHAGQACGRRTAASQHQGLVEDPAEEATARLLLARKYHEMEDEQTLSEWARTALPVAIDLNPLASK